MSRAVMAPEVARVPREKSSGGAGDLVIYDFGMNNGDDVEYYLKKGFKVVGVEANPKLCALSTERFADNIADGQLVILNMALSANSSPELITFYIHKTYHILSQLPQPEPTSIVDFEAIQVPQRKASEIVLEHGPPHYIKIDLEGMDSVVLADLFQAGILPEFISAEAQSVEVFALMVSYGYKSFNLVDANSVRKSYANARIATPRGEAEHSFKHHSAGPYGYDIISPWRDSKSFFYFLAWERFGWKDIHASRVIEPSSEPPVSMKLSFRAHLKDFIPSFIRAVKRRFRLYMISRMD